jgi:hypothetical protein
MLRMKSVPKEKTAYKKRIKNRRIKTADIVFTGSLALHSSQFRHILQKFEYHSHALSFNLSTLSQHILKTHIIFAKVFTQVTKKYIK